MGMIVKDYLTHTNVQFLFLALFASLAAISELSVWEHWPWLVLVVVSAPFYEWITHKFVLHGALSPFPGRWRDYQIRLHHGHHLDPADRALQFAPASAIFNYDDTALSVLCAGVLEHYCSTGASGGFHRLLSVLRVGSSGPSHASLSPAHAHGLSIARRTYAPSFSQ